MCRHLAYLGPPASLRSLLIDPPHSLYRQAWAPRLQRHGTVNADGFGIGWYAGADPVPARYRRGEPIWGDPSLPDIARVTRSGAVLAAVRSATRGHGRRARRRPRRSARALAVQPQRAAGGWPRPGCRLAARAATGRRGRRCPAVAGGDGRLGVAVGAHAAAAARGLPMDAALAGTIAAVEAAGGTGRFNLLLTDGRSIAATACGDTLWYRRGRPGGRSTGRVRAGRRRARLDRGARPARADRHSRVGWLSVRPARLAAAAAGPAARQHASRARSRQRRPHRRDRDRMTTIENRLPADYRAASLRADALAGSPPRRSRCRRSGSTTRRAARCSRRSPNCPSTTRPGPSGPSCGRSRRRSPRSPGRPPWSSSARARRRRRGCCCPRCATRARCAGTCRST